MENENFQEILQFSGHKLTKLSKSPLITWRGIPIVKPNTTLSHSEVTNWNQMFPKKELKEINCDYLFGLLTALFPLTC